MPKYSRVNDRARRERLKKRVRSLRANAFVVNMPIDHSKQAQIPVSEYNYLVEYTNEMTEAAASFDLDISKISIITCSNCKRTLPDLKLYVDEKCSPCVKDSMKFTSNNNMDPGIVPVELQNMTYIEQMLIAQVHPVITLYRIRGAQYGYAGNVINFRQNIDSYITELPVHPKSLITTIIFQKETLAGIAEFQARADKLRNALLWLKNHNIYYKHITISETNLSAIPESGDVSQLLLSLNIDPNISENLDSIDEAFVPLIDTLDQENHIVKKLNLPYPEFDTKPINEFSDEGYIAKAFPCLFPTGNADFLQPRAKSLTHEEYFKFLMEYEDGRFAKDPRFRFFAMNTSMRRQTLATSGIYIRRSNLLNSNVEEIRNRIRNDRSFIQQIMVYSSKLRSTKPYWAARCSELLSMVEQLGSPSVFFTLSAADYYWPDLFTLLAPADDPLTIPDNERRTLMHNNPLIVSWFFQRRCLIFLDKVLKPIFKVKDFWFRFEWQHRGSPHLHGLLWLENCPVTDLDKMTEEHLREIKSYFESLCLAINPIHPENRPLVHPSRKTFTQVNPYERLNDLGHLINAFQRHTICGRHCLRESKNKQLKCRFNFPKELQESCSITSLNGYPQFLAKRNDAWVARYNPLITQIWRANTDFTPIISRKAVFNYIAKYASKGEKSSISYVEMLNTIIQKLNYDSPAKSAIQKLMISSLGERDYSSQEVLHISMGWPLYRASRTFVVLTVRDDEWNNLIVNQSEETVTVKESLVDKYKKRPENLARINLFQFSKKYYTRSGRYVARKKEAIVRVFPKIRLSSDPARSEEFYKLQCILSIPFFGEFATILGERGCETWREAYEHAGIMELNLLDFPEQEDEGALPERLNEGNIQDTFMVAAAFRGETTDHILGKRLIDLSHDWNSMSSRIPAFSVVTEFLKTYKNNIQRQIHAAKQLSIRFSSDQQEVLDVVTKQIESLTRKIIEVPKRIVVQGKAGSGKSTLIKEIVRLVCSFIGEDSIKVCAPTGAAAINIEGNTIHSLFHFPLVANKFKALEGETARKYQNDLRNLRFLIIDEMSMIGARMLYMIEKRTREIHPEIQEPFGGLFVILFGDYRQLPPVKDAPIYAVHFFDPMAQQGWFAFNTFQRFFELTNSHRQSEADRSFRELLDRLAMGLFTDNDHILLCTRNQAYLSQPELETFAQAIELYPTNEQVQTSNNNALMSTQRPVALIASENFPDIAMSPDDDSKLNLAAKLYLSINSRVMLRTNLWVEGGLVNGSLGTVRHIIYSLDQHPPSLPQFILVEFDNFKGPYILDNLFPVIPITRSWNDGSITRSRRQFPLTLAYAMTIHKAQGLTVSKVKIDIGQREAALGLTYVALSRAKKLTDIVFVHSYNKDRYDSICKSKAHDDRQKFLQKFYAKN